MWNWWYDFWYGTIDTILGDFQRIADKLEAHAARKDHEVAVHEAKMDEHKEHAHNARIERERAHSASAKIRELTR